MRSPIITLTQDECAEADRVANERARQVIERGYKMVNGESSDPAAILAMHTLGARAEYAGRKWLEPIAWNRFDMSAADLGDDLDMKGVARPEDRLLIVPDRCKADWAYILARGWAHPNWAISGWISGAVALMHPEWIVPLQAGRDCYAVPNECLAPISEIWDYVERTYPVDGGRR